MLTQGWWVIHLLSDTPWCSLGWVSPILPTWDKESNSTCVAPDSLQTSEQRGAPAGQHGGCSAGQCVNDVLWPGWDQGSFPVSSCALTNRLLYSLKECTSNQRHPCIVAAFNNSFPHLVENRTGFPDQNTKLPTWPTYFLTCSLILIKYFSYLKNKTQKHLMSDV